VAPARGPCGTRRSALRRPALKPAAIREGWAGGGRATLRAVRPRRRWPAVYPILLAFLPLVLLACGYTIDRAPPATSPDAPRFAIRTLRNDSFEPGIERVVTSALRRQWQQRARFRLVDDPARAQWVLTGRVLPLLTQPRTLSSVVLALEYSVTLQVELTLEELPQPDRAGKRQPLPAGLLRDTEIYFASADLEATRKNREEALRLIADLIAQRVADVVDDEVGS